MDGNQKRKKKKEKKREPSAYYTVVHETTGKSEAKDYLRPLPRLEPPLEGPSGVSTIIASLYNPVA